MREEAPVPNTVIETESVNEMEGRAAANQESITPVSSQYFLVCESGFLLVVLQMIKAPSVSIPIFR